MFDILKQDCFLFVLVDMRFKGVRVDEEKTKTFGEEITKQKHRNNKSTIEEEKQE